MRALVASMSYIGEGAQNEHEKAVLENELDQAGHGVDLLNQ